MARHTVKAPIVKTTSFPGAALGSWVQAGARLLLIAKADKEKGGCTHRNSRKGGRCSHLHILGNFWNYILENIERIDAPLEHEALDCEEVFASHLGRLVSMNCCS